MTTSLQTHLAEGWQVAGQQGNQTILTRRVKGPLQINRFWHLVGILCTGGLWGVIWVVDEMKAWRTETTAVPS